MAILGFAVPAVALVAITNATLQAFGRIDLPLVSMFLGALVKMFGDYYLIGDPRFGIVGAPISTAVCYWLIALLICSTSQGCPMRCPRWAKPWAGRLPQRLAWGRRLISALPC